MWVEIEVNFGSGLLYGASITAVKLSVLSFYRRVFSAGISQKIIVRCEIVVVLWCVVSTIFNLFECIPIEKVWDPSVRGQCIRLRELEVGMQSVNALLDLILLLLPIAHLYRLRNSKPKTHKISVTVAYIFGVL